MKLWVMLGLMGLVVAFLLVLFLFIFWFVMVIDCCKRKFTKGSERLIWLTILLFTNVLGVIIYYFLIKKYNPEGLIDKDGHLK